MLAFISPFESTQNIFIIFVALPAIIGFYVSVIMIYEQYFNHKGRK